MRTEFVSQAVAPISNRFLLVHVASAITRKFHRPAKDRMAESINNSLAGLGEGRYFVWPDRTISGIVTPEQAAVAIATGQLKPSEAGGSHRGFNLCSCGHGDCMSQMSMIPNRTPLVIGQPRCVLCRELIDVWAQFVCDDCRRLPLWEFVCKYRAVAA